MPGWLNWQKAVIGIGALMLAGIAIWLYGNAREHGGKLEERVKWQELVRKRDREIADINAANAKRWSDAFVTYAGKENAIQPIIIQGQAAVREFAQTPAGAVQCLAADRVRGIEASAAQLGLDAPSAASGGNGALPPHADTRQP